MVTLNDSSYVIRNVSVGESIRILQLTPLGTRELRYLVPEIEPEPLFAPLVSSSVSCSASASATLQAFPSPAHTVDWYDAPVGGTLLASGKLTLAVSRAGTYYAETRDPTLPCRATSSQRSSGTVTFQKVLCPTLLVSRVR